MMTNAKAMGYSIPTYAANLATFVSPSGDLKYEKDVLLYEGRRVKFILSSSFDIVGQEFGNTSSEKFMNLVKFGLENNYKISCTAEGLSAPPLALVVKMCGEDKLKILEGLRAFRHGTILDSNLFKNNNLLMKNAEGKMILFCPHMLKMMHVLEHWDRNHLNTDGFKKENFIFFYVLVGENSRRPLFELRQWAKTSGIKLIIVGVKSSYVDINMEIKDSSSVQSMIVKTASVIDGFEKKNYRYFVHLDQSVDEFSYTNVSGNRIINNLINAFSTAMNERLHTLSANVNLSQKLMVKFEKSGFLGLGGNPSVKVTGRGHGCEGIVVLSEAAVGMKCVKSPFDKETLEFSFKNSKNRGRIVLVVSYGKQDGYNNRVVGGISDSVVESDTDVMYV
jgi:hypothetical protein